MSQSETYLPVDAAYEAARDRAVRTTEALILAEGQVVALQRALVECQSERDKYAAEAGKLAMMRSRRRIRDRARRERKAEGVKDAPEDADPIGYTGAIGQAD